MNKYPLTRCPECKQVVCWYLRKLEMDEYYSLYCNKCGFIPDRETTKDLLSRYSPDRDKVRRRNILIKTLRKQVGWLQDKLKDVWGIDSLRYVKDYPK